MYKYICMHTYIHTAGADIGSGKQRRMHKGDGNRTHNAKKLGGVLARSDLKALGY